MNKKLGYIFLMMMLMIPLVATLATAGDCEIEDTKTNSVEGDIETLFKDGNKTYVFIDIDDGESGKGIVYVFIDVSITDYATLSEAEEDGNWLTIYYEEDCDGCRILAIHVADDIKIHSSLLVFIVGITIGFFIGVFLATIL